MTVRRVLDFPRRMDLVEEDGSHIELNNIPNASSAQSSSTWQPWEEEPLEEEQPNVEDHPPATRRSKCNKIP